MHTRATERIGLTLAALSLAINILLAMAHMGLFVERLGMNGAAAPVSASAPGVTEASLMTALAQICSGHGLTQRAGGGDADKSTPFASCPLCFFFAAASLILAMGNLFLILRRISADRLQPLAASRRLSAFLQSIAQPRAPPSHWIAA
ncbi:MAG: hypothetical protein P4L72_10010 [Parvibaculum sp.]|jgi:hypothetical protein|uniref:DUF2946 family protein n=1 Tax=Parvibaculum sp. TaxID=2024848 RepID=UPI00284E44C5|nr:DUF2946 family protein [Parvibaculum sp.]MDR3499548.1 hypothetical protein [Parvibaculum sp.]